MDHDAIAEKLDQLQVDVAELKRTTLLGVKLGFSTKEAALLTSVGEEELRRWALAPPTSPFHVRVLRIGRKIVFPRSELERLLQGEG